jgi:nodulation protein E
MGAICALGNNVPEIWGRLRTGCCGFGPIEAVDATRLRVRQGAEVRSFNPSEQIDPSKLALMDRFCQLAFVAAREAVKDSGLAINGFDASVSQAPTEQNPTTEGAIEAGDIGVIVGTGGGAMITAEQVAAQAHKGRVHPFSVPRFMSNSACSQISMEFGITGSAFTVSSACASSNHAIGQAFWMVRSGQLKAVIAGGAEAPFCLSTLKAWEELRVLSPDVCRPFSTQRHGIVLGEGAAMLVLEDEQSARARGATIYGEIVGCGFSSDASHITKPSLEGPVQAMRAALRDAGIEPMRVGHINAHGTGTPANDPVESQAIRSVFGNHLLNLPVTSTKSMHGHALGASGALESVATILALRDGILPPTINFISPDPECELDIVANCSRQSDAEFALSNSFAFGGLNAVLAFRRS